MKLFLLLLSLLFISSSYAESVRPERYIVVGVSGFGTRRPENAWQPSAVHERLPSHYRIENSYKLVHFANQSEVNEVLEEFQCHDGKQNRKDLGLIIMANSWGSSKALKLAKKYSKLCGRSSDLFFMIDGVRKPLFANGTKPKAQQCFSFYQRKGLVRGKAIKGCTNVDFTKKCNDMGYGAVNCHIYVEWEGARRASQLVNRFLKNQ